MTKNKDEKEQERLWLVQHGAAIVPEDCVKLLKKEQKEAKLMKWIFKGIELGDFGEAEGGGLIHVIAFKFEREDGKRVKHKKVLCREGRTNDYEQKSLIKQIKSWDFDNTPGFKE